MKTTTTSIFRFIAVFLLIASTLASSAFADYVEASSYWAANRGSSISVRQGASPDLLVFISSDAEFRLWIDVLRNGVYVRNVVSNVPVLAGVGNPYLHTFPIPTTGLGGDYVVRVQVRNGAAFDDSFVDLHVATDPIVNPVPAQPPMNEGESRTIQVSALDADGDRVSLEASVRYCIMGMLCFAQALPAEATFTDRGDGTGVLQFQPGFDFVIHPDRTEDITFQFRAYDGVRRTAWRGVPLTVNDVNRIPQIISLPITTAQENTLYQYQVVALDADPEDSLTYGLPISPTGMTIDDSTGLIRWTPDYTQAGDHNVIVEASDRIDAVRQSFIITVNDVPFACSENDNIAARGCVCQAPLADVGGICTVPAVPLCVDGDNIAARGCTCQAPLTDVGGICTVPAVPLCVDGDNIAARGCTCQVPLADVGGICTVPAVPLCVDGDNIAARGCMCQAPLADVGGLCTVPVVPVPGCTDPAALNYNPAANVNDGSCTYPPGTVLGCTDPAALNYNPLATVDDGSCTYPPGTVLGCTDPAALNYNPLATVDNGSCKYPPAPVCADGDNIAGTGCVCQAPLTDVGGICTVPPAPLCVAGDNIAARGCTCQAPLADVGGICLMPPPAPVVGCSDPRAKNFDRRVTLDDGTCEYLRRGVVILSVHPSQEAVSAGDSVQFNVDVQNNADNDAHHLQLRVMLYDLSEVGYGRQFNLRSGRSTSQAAVLNIPYGVWPGTYLVQITVDNGRVRDTAYRELVIH